MSVTGLALVSASCVLCFLVLYAQGFVNLNSPSGPYEIEVHKLESCPDSGTGETVFRTRITKLNRTTYVYNEDIRVEPAVDENSKMHVELQEYGNQGYRPRSFEYTVKNCAEMFTLAGDNIKKMFQAAGVTVEKCPIPAGNFSVRNFVLDFNMASKIPVMKYGSYRVIMNLFHKGKKVGCLMGSGDSVRKQIV